MGIYRIIVEKNEPIIHSLRISSDPPMEGALNLYSKGRVYLGFNKYSKIMATYYFVAFGKNSHGLKKIDAKEIYFIPSPSLGTSNLAFGREASVS